MADNDDKSPPLSPEDQAKLDAAVKTFFEKRNEHEKSRPRSLVGKMLDRDGAKHAGGTLFILQECQKDLPDHLRHRFRIQIMRESKDKISPPPDKGRG